MNIEGSPMPAGNSFRVTASSSLRGHRLRVNSEERRPAAVDVPTSADKKNWKWCRDRDAKHCFSIDCQIMFSSFVRKHHCRECGGVFCSDCSDQKKSLSHLGFAGKVRVCKSCFESGSLAFQSPVIKFRDRAATLAMVPGSSCCIQCKQHFTLMNRRRHCRACGNIFCRLFCCRHHVVM